MCCLLITLFISLVIAAPFIIFRQPSDTDDYWNR
jgi:hypothetical protein